MTVLISSDEVQYHRSQIESNDKHAIKRSLQRLCELHRLGQRPAYLDRRALENMLLGRLEVFKQDAKIVRWCLNLLAFVGTNASTDSIVRAASLHSGDSKIVAAAVSALCSIHKFDEAPWDRIEGVDPSVRTLAALQQLPVDRVNPPDGFIAIEKASPAVLELALVLVGLGRAPENLFDPKHSNPAIVKVLGGHHDEIVQQYTVWAANENKSLGIDALGIPLKEIAVQKSNVRSWMYQLVISCAPPNGALISILEQGSRDEIPEVRAGLARGLVERYEDGFEPIVIDWLSSEDSQECIRNIERHIVRYSDQVESYRKLCLDWFRRLHESSVGRKNMYAAAAGKALYGEFRRLEMSTNTDLFFNHGEKSMTVNNQFNINNAGQIAIGGNTQNFGSIEVASVQDGVSKLSELLSGLEAKIDALGLDADKKRTLERVVADVKKKPTKSSLEKLIGFAKTTNFVVTESVASVEAWQAIFSPIMDVAEKLLAML